MSTEHEDLAAGQAESTAPTGPPLLQTHITGQARKSWGAQDSLIPRAYAVELKVTWALA